MDPSSDQCSNLRFILYPIGMLISTIFLVISLCIYILVPELRNFNGKCLMCHMASLLFAYFFLAALQVIGEFLSDNVCIIFGFIIYFSLLCSFFWLNIMCIDICIAFSSIRPMIGSIPELEKRKFLLYMLYAWGIPFVITLITAIMELHPGVPDTFYKPKFKITCWFYSDESRMAYFVVPVGVIVLCNIILFLITALNIFKMKKENKIRTGGGRREDKKQDRNRFQLYIKLSIVMGINWAMEILSWLIGGSKCIWLFTDTLNTLQGFFIFLIFVWNKKVWRLIKRRLYRKRVTNSSIPIEDETTEEPSDGASSSIVPSTSANESGNIPFKTNNAIGTMNKNETPPTEQKEENTRL